MGKHHKANRLSPKLIASIILALFFGIALFLRVYFPYDRVFSGDWIKFTGVDAYYYMRIVDNLVHNFPHLSSFNPYFIYPDGGGVTSILFFGWLLAAIIWVIGLGSPTQHTIDVVSVYFPAVLGALTVIPVYFIGKELFGRWAGLIAAGLIGLLPGEFLGRSILGFTDHHVAEVLFTTIAILFLILAVKTAREKQLTFSHLNRRDWATITKPIIYSLLAGVFLGIYLLTWAGALLFVFIIFVYFIIQFIIDHLKHKSTDYLCLVGVILFFVGLLMFLTVSPGRLHLASMVIALLTPPVLCVISRLMAYRGIKPAYYPLTLVLGGLAGMAIFHIINPLLLSSMLGKFSIFAPVGVTPLTTLEMQPLLFPGGNFSLSVVWGNFTTSFFLSLIALGILIYLVIKQGDADKSLLIVWTLIILAAALGQRRFAYYLAVNMALLTGYLSWQILKFAGFRELVAKAIKTPQKVAREKAKLRKSYLRKGSPSAGFPITTHHINMALAVLIVFFVAFFPNIIAAPATAKAAPFAPSDAWVSSLTWLKENTPDPFGDPDFYYKLHEPSLSPKPAYGVMAWWDYGYWISRIGHRVPNTNPGQPPVPITNTARFFLSQDENSANEIIQEMGSLYIIIDYPTVTGKFWAIATWAGREKTEFFDIYLVPRANRLEPKLLYYPEYYRSLVVRLYNFDGKAVTPEKTTVISYQEVSREGETYKIITNWEEFDSYQAAEAYLLTQEVGNYKIVGTDPLVSPVPLEALKHYQLIHSSDDLSVKIFEYVAHQ